MDYVAMVALGSGGVFKDYDFIIARLPYAVGLECEKIFWNMNKVKVEEIDPDDKGGRTLIE